MSDDDEEAMLEREVRRRERRAKRKEAFKADPHLQWNMAKKVAAMGTKTPQQVEYERMMRERNVQPFRPCCDVYLVQQRLGHVGDEIKRINQEIDGQDERYDEIAETEVALSVMRGGTKRMRRREMLAELKHEQVNLFDMVTLHDVDEELYRAYKQMYDPRAPEFFLTKALHGFPQMQVVQKAVIALENTSNRLLAKQVAYTLIDDILDWMLEGWYFGERISERQVSGFVPSLKATGPLTVFDINRLAEKEKDEKKEIELEEERRKRRTAEMMGTPLDKWEPIELQAQELAKERKAVQKGSDLEHELNETEQNLRFGLFSLTLM